MLVALIIFTTYVLLPSIVGYAVHLKNNPHKLEKYRKLRYWRAPEILATTYTLIIFAILILITIHSHVTEVPSIYGQALLATSGVIALLFIATWAERPRKHIGKHLKIYWILFGVTALIVSIFSSIISDMIIVELTGLPPQELPAAQKLLTFVMQPLSWFVSISLALVYASPIGALIIFFIMLRKPRKDGKTSKDEVLSLVALTAIITTPFIMLAFSGKALDKDFYVPNLKSLIVFSSFHLDPLSCGLELPEGAKLSIMSYKRAAVATPDNHNDYIFSVADCEFKTD